MSFTRSVCADLSYLCLTALLVLDCVVSQTTSPTSTPACCALKLMDASQQVAIETDRLLTPGQYQAASVRVCSTDNVFIQLWTRINDNTYQLKWQTNFTPSTGQTYQTYVTIPFASSNLPTITTNDRLGLYGVVSLSSAFKLNIPYESNTINSSVQFTQSRYADPTLFTLGLQVTVDDIHFSRSFASYVRFCSTPDCSDVPADVPQTISTQSWYSSSTSKPFCGCPTSCSPDSLLSDTINQQGSNIRDLQTRIKKMGDLIDSMSSSNVQTGYCPDDSLPGVYGIGSCYIIYRQSVQLGVAAVTCATNHAANLLDIESDVEERFIYNIVTANGTINTGVETYWTAGMYNLQTQQWMWYRQDMTPRVPITAASYSGWLNNQEPLPISDTDVCLTATVDQTNQNIYWQKSICFSENYFICELPKMCY